MRGVALPVEHGAWSLWFEPVLLALLIAPSRTGMFIALLSLASLLIRQPLKVMLIDLRKGKMYQRTRQGALFVCLYACIAAVAALAVFWRGDHHAFLPLMPAYVVAAIVIWRFDVGGKGRDWLPEVLAAAIMSTFAVGICLAGNWAWDQSAAVGAIVLARAVPAVVYVRARLRQIKSGHDSQLLPIALHTAALCAVFVLYWLALAPLLAVVAALVLLARAVHFLRRGTLISPRTVGIQEVALGIIYVALVAAGFLGSI